MQEAAERAASVLDGVTTTLTAAVPTMTWSEDSPPGTVSSTEKHSCTYRSAGLVSAAAPEDFLELREPFAEVLSDEGVALEDIQSSTEGGSARLWTRLPQDDILVQLTEQPQEGAMLIIHGPDLLWEICAP